MKIIALGVASFYLSGASAFAPSGSKYAVNNARSNLEEKFTSSSTELMMAAAESKSPLDFFAGLFSRDDPAPAAEPEKPKIPDVVVDSDFTLSYVFGAIGLFVILTSPADWSNFPGPPSVLGVIQGGLNLLFASFLAVQAQRIRFVFDETSFELKNVDFGASDDEVLKASGENFVVGGANRWDYDTFVNYDFFPSVDYPILVYFKETQTPAEKWNEGPGQFDKSGNDGQIHFFPAIANVKQLQEQFKLRGCAKIDE